MRVPRTSSSFTRALRATRWTADDARHVLAAWRESGQSVGAFARGHGLTSQRLTWWQERLADWEAAPAASVGAFVPVVSGGDTGAAVRVRLPGGATIEVDSQAVPAVWIASLVRELLATSER